MTDYTDRTAWLTPIAEFYVYRYFMTSSQALYIGATAEIGPRLYAHRSRPWYSQAARLEVAVFTTEDAMQVEERLQIHAFHPIVNNICYVCPGLRNPLNVWPDEKVAFRRSSS
jgi:hypothetical protein